MNFNKTKKVLSTVTFMGMLLLNVPVYANVAPPTVTTEETTVVEATTTGEVTATEEATTTEEVTATEEATTTEEVTATEEVTTTEEEVVDAGLTPDSALYFLDRLLEDIQITLTFDDVNKAALLASITEERLAEVNYLLEKAQTEEVNTEEWDALIQDVISDYKLTLEEALQSIEGVAVELSDEEKAGLDSILEKIENVASIDEEVIAEDEEAKELVDRAILVAAVVKDLDKEKVAAIREQGLGLGQISQIFALAEASGLEVEEVAVLFTEQGMGLGDASKVLGIHPSELAKKKVAEMKAKKNGTVELEDAVEEETTEQDVTNTSVDATQVDDETTTTEETDVENSVNTQEVQKKSEVKKEEALKKAQEKKAEGQKKAEQKKNKK